MLYQKRFGITLNEYTLYLDVGYSLAQPQKRPEPQDFLTHAPIQRDITDYHHKVPQTPPWQQQQTNNWSGNQQQQQQQVYPTNEAHRRNDQWSGQQRPNSPQYDAFQMGGAQYPGAGAKQWSGQKPLDFTSVNQPQQKMFPMDGAQPKGGGAWQWSDQQSQLSATPPRQAMQAWGEDHRQQSNETTKPQSPVTKSEVAKKVPLKSKRELGELIMYVHTVCTSEFHHIH